MDTFVAITFGLLSITAHELGHYEAMRRCHIRIKEISLLGFPIPFLPSIYIKIKNTTWSVHPFIIGAYVEQYSNDKTESKRLWDQLYINGNGPIANIVYALILLAIAVGIKGIRTGQIEKAGIVLLTTGGIACLLWLGRRYIALVLPVLTIPILILVGDAILSVNPMEAIESGPGGPIALIEFLAGAETIEGALLLAASLSIGLGIVNLSPLNPLDGGHILGAVLKTWFGEKFKNVHNWITTPLFIVIVVYSLGLDVVRIWKWIW
ncbi:MAG: M50 family metallopeptidase [Minisyncoccia bacterium]